MMPFREKFFLVVLLWSLLGVSSVFAHPHSHGDHLTHQHEGFSPFSDKASSLHCLLRGHNNSSVCPHTKPAKSQSAPAVLTRNCGRKAAGSVPKITSFSNDFVEIGIFSLNHNWAQEKIAPPVSIQLECFIDSLDPPPILI